VPVGLAQPGLLDFRPRWGFRAPGRKGKRKEGHGQQETQAGGALVTGCGVLGKAGRAINYHNVLMYHLSGSDTQGPLWGQDLFGPESATQSPRATFEPPTSRLRANR
jgi:hypothetical protein